MFLFLVLFLLSFNAQVSAGEKAEIKPSNAEKKQILTYARTLYDNKEEAVLKNKLSPKLNKVSNPIILSLFNSDGVFLGSIRNEDTKTNLSDRLKKTVFELRKMAFQHPTKRVSTFIKKIKMATDIFKAKPNFLHVMVVSHTAKFANFGIKGLFDYKVYEPQVTGLAYELKGKRAEINPLEALLFNFGSKSSRNYLAKKLKIDPKKMIAYNDLVIEVYDVIHFGEGFPKRKFTNYHRGHKVFTHKDVTYAELKNRLKHVGSWYKNNVKNDEVTFIYYPSTGKYKNSSRTMVRSTMAVWVLNKLATYLNDEKLKALGQETTNFYLERYFNMTESLKAGHLIPSEKPTKRGEIAKNRYTTAGFLAMSLLESGGYEKHKKEIDLLMDWLMKNQREDGIFWTEFAQSQYFMPGQLLLSVATVYEKTKDKKYKTYFEKSFEAYAKQIGNMMRLGNKHYTPYAPAWFTQPFAKMYLLTKEKKYKDMVFAINDNVAKWYKLNAEDQIYFDYDGMLAPKPGSNGNNSITSAALESLTDAAFVAKKSGDTKRFQEYSFVIKRTVAYLMRLQYTPENTYYIQARHRVIGGFKTNLINTRVWMDNVWHLTSAFMKIEKEKLLGK